MTQTSEHTFIFQAQCQMPTAMQHLSFLHPAQNPQHVAHIKPSCAAHKWFIAHQSLAASLVVKYMRCHVHYLYNEHRSRHTFWSYGKCTFLLFYHRVNTGSISTRYYSFFQTYDKNACQYLLRGLSVIKKNK